MKLYLECYSGISGDMLVGALLDLGADKNVLLETIDGLHLKGYQIKIGKVKKSGIVATDFDVVLDEDNHDHNMDYLYGHLQGEQNHEHHHSDLHSCNSENHEHHSNRGLSEITEIINNNKVLTENARGIAIKIFTILAEAESVVHGTPIEQVHFHEVGAVDSIIDIVSIGVCLDNLAVKDVVVTSLAEGTATVRCQHGILPVPVPAVSNIASRYHIPLSITKTVGELVTPTGAAAVAAVMSENVLPSKFIINKIGVGAGKRNYPSASGLLRAMLIE